MTIAKKIDGAWVAQQGSQTLGCMVATKQVIENFADGRRQVSEVACEPYPVEVQLDMARVEALLAEGTWSGADLVPYGLKVAAAFTVPEGKRIAGALRLVEVDGAPHEDFDLEDIPPPPPPPSAAEKLAAAGLTVDELRQLLGLGAG